MSKIAEKMHNVAAQKAEEYSKTHGHSIIEEVAYGRGYKTAYIECYDQAMQDLMEKAEEFFKSELYVSVSDQICSVNEFKTMKDFVNYFKNYMQETN